MLENLDLSVLEKQFEPVSEVPENEFYTNPEDLAQILREQLIPLELTLSLEYLYAYFSLRHAEEVTAEQTQFPSLAEDLSFVRRTLLMISVGEMTHYRWAHQLLWLLQDEGLVAPVTDPGIQLAQRVPRPDESGPAHRGFRNAALRPLTPEFLADLIAVERPSGYIDGAYGKLVSTLRQPKYPQHLYELAAKIDGDGMGHYKNLLEVQRVLDKYVQLDATDAYLRPLQVGTFAATADALEHYREILVNVQQTYASIPQGEFRAAGTTASCARDQMTYLQEKGEVLARRGIGLPFFAEVVAGEQPWSGRDLLKYLEG
ncbi:MAG: ferritin-like domain-containing protein [Cyanobacteria bacterium P01_H01_bin.162]